jgi:hypothetical protein
MEQETSSFNRVARQETKYNRYRTNIIILEYIATVFVYVSSAKFFALHQVKINLPSYIYVE